MCTEIKALSLSGMDVRSEQSQTHTRCSHKHIHCTFQHIICMYQNVLYFSTLPASIVGFQRWKALMAREFTLIKRTMILYKAKSFQIFVLGICAATLFLRTHVHPVSPNDGQEIAGFTFFGLLVIMVNGIAEMAMAVSQLLTVPLPLLLPLPLPLPVPLTLPLALDSTPAATLALLSPFSCSCP